MPKARNGARRSSPARGKTDDLTVIEGIGAARSEWLRRSLNVRTYRDLAGQSTDDIVGALRGAGQVASRSVVEKWIARAQELATAAERLDWGPLASFVVEFQGRQGSGDLRTVVHHVEGDQNESWAGIETGRVSHWMLARAPKPVGEPAPAPRPTSAPTSAPLTIGPMTLLGQGQAASPRENVVEGSLARWLGGDEPFALEVPLEVESGSTPRGEHRVRVYAENLETADRTHLGDALVAGSGPRYAAVVDGCRLSEGVYRLNVLVSEGDRLAPTTLVAPLLRIG
jgi:hypothetical protein